MEETRILEARVSELRAVNGTFGPHLAVSEKGTLISLSLMELLGPLVHLDLAFQTVTVFGDYTKLLVAQILRVRSLSRDVHQAVVIVFVWLLVVDRYAGLSGPENEL